MMNRYETAFIIAPNLSEEETSTLIKQLVDVVVSKNGQMIKQDLWGKRKLAYPIKKFNEGFYVFLTYQGEPAVPAELERRFRQTESVLRFMTIRKDAHDLVTEQKRAKLEASESASKNEDDSQAQSPSSEEVN
jgi:small subunit ribosomal protein S6